VWHPNLLEALFIAFLPFVLLNLFVLLPTLTGKYNHDLAIRLLYDGSQFFDLDVTEPTKLGRHLFGTRAETAGQFLSEQCRRSRRGT